MLYNSNGYGISGKTAGKRWLILSALLAIIILQACSPPSTVRYSNSANHRNDYNKKIKLKNNSNNAIKEQGLNNIAENDDSDEDNPIAQFEKLIAENNNTKPTSDKTQFVIDSNTDDTVPRLPTLREQMSILNTEQSSIKESIINIETDVNQIKNQLDAITGTLIDMQDHSVSAGSPPTAAKVVPKEEKKEFIISSDKKPESLPTNNKTQDNSNKNNDNNQSGKSNYLLAKSKYEESNYEEALPLLIETLKTEKNAERLSEINYMIAMSYYNTDSHSDALPFFERVMKGAVGSYKPAAYLYLAESLNRSGEKTKARSMYQELIANYPESKFVPQARRMLQRL